MKDAKAEPWMGFCECEHGCHFDQGTGHLYGKPFGTDDLVRVGTMYGIFTVCMQCAAECHGKV
jgi:hypothetical protein